MARKLRVLILQPAQQKAQRILQKELAKLGWGAPDLAIGKKTAEGKPRMRTVKICGFDSDLGNQVVGFPDSPCKEFSE